MDRRSTGGRYEVNRRCKENRQDSDKRWTGGRQKVDRK